MKGDESFVISNGKTITTEQLQKKEETQAKAKRTKERRAENNKITKQPIFKYKDGKKQTPWVFPFIPIRQYLDELDIEKPLTANDKLIYWIIISKNSEKTNKSYWYWKGAVLWNLSKYWINRRTQQNSIEKLKDANLIHTNWYTGPRCRYFINYKVELNYIKKSVEEKEKKKRKTN